MELTARGFVNKPKTREYSGGTFSTYTLSVGQRKKEKGEWVKKNPAFFNVTDFTNSSPPEEGSLVTVTGYLDVREYDKNGVKRISLDLKATNVELASYPKAKPSPAEAPTKPDVSQPWDPEEEPPF